MDLELASSAIDKRFGWECDFHFGYGQDLLEETSINEQSCIQVLKILIAKAEAEMFELEDDLAILQSQLKWAEHDEHGVLYKVWTDTFQEKINFLNASVQGMKNEKVLHGHDLNVKSEFHGRSAERIYHIISDLLRDHCSTNNGQMRGLHDTENMLDSDSLNADKVKEKGISAKDGSFIFPEPKEKQTGGKVLNLSKGSNMPDNSNPPGAFVKITEQNLIGSDSNSGSFVRPDQKSSVNQRLDKPTNAILTCIISNSVDIKSICKSSVERKETEASKTLDSSVVSERKNVNLAVKIEPTYTISELYQPVPSTCIITNSNDLRSICESIVERKEKDGPLDCGENAAHLMQNDKASKTLGSSVISETNNVNSAVKFEVLENDEKSRSFASKRDRKTGVAKRGKFATAKYRSSSNLSVGSDGKFNIRESGHSDSAKPDNLKLIGNANPYNLQFTDTRSLGSGLASSEEIPFANLILTLQGVTKRKPQHSGSCHVNGRKVSIPEAKKLRPGGTCKDHPKQYSRVVADGKESCEIDGNWAGSALPTDACVDSQKNTKGTASGSDQLVQMKTPVFSSGSESALQNDATNGIMKEDLNGQNGLSLRELQSLKVDDLRAIAKRYGVKGVYKLKKELLVNELLGRFMDCSADGV